MSTDEMTREELREELRRHDLPVSGRKDELRERLARAQQAEGAEKGRRSQQREAARQQDGEQGDEQDQEQDGEQDHEQDGEQDGGRDHEQGGERASRSRDGSSPSPGRIAQLAARQLGALTGRRTEGVAGLSREEGGWRVAVEILEVSRIPPTTDVLGTYAVWVDDDGELLGYERVERFLRGQASGGEE